MCNNKYLELDEWAKLAQRGSEHAWIDIYATLWPAAVEFARRTTRLPRDLAEDLAQEAFLRALTKLRNWDPDLGHFSAWFFGILRRRCEQYWRSNPPNRMAYLEEDFDMAMLGEDAGILAIEYREVLSKPLSLLSRPQREILFLRVVGGFKSHEIAEMMNIMPDAVRQRLTTIRRILRKAIEEGIIDE